MQAKYENDFYAWTMETVNLLRQGRLKEIEIDHLIEEVESMGRSERNQLLNRFVVLMSHLLKWQYQPGLRGNSWKYTLKEQRKKLDKLLKENPSLKSKREELMSEAYEYAILQAARETGFADEFFPQNCPYTFHQCLDENFYPF